MILQGALSVLVTLLIALWLGRFLEIRLMRASTLDINLRVMLSKLSQALLALGTILIALPAVGIDITPLSVFGGMLGVGIGFGLRSDIYREIWREFKKHDIEIPYPQREVRILNTTGNTSGATT